MSQASDKTEVHTADNLKPADKAGSSEKQYSVNVKGTVYAVTASSAEEAGEKAKKLHKKNEGDKS